MKTGEQALTRIEQTMEALIRQFPLRGIHLACGPAPSVRGATVTRSPRIVITTEHNHLMRIPAKDGSIRQADVLPTQATYVASHAWNAPDLTRIASFLTLDFQSDHTRYYHSVGLGIDATGRRYSDAAVWFRAGPAIAPIQHILTALEDLPFRIPEPTAEHSATELAQAVIRLAKAQLRGNPAAQAKDRITAYHEAIEQFIDEHISEDLSRARIAALLNLHPNHISRIFAGNPQGSLQHMITRRRLAFAKRLMQDPTLTIKEIVFRSGFKSHNYFCHVFRKWEGVHPTNWRSASYQDSINQFPPKLQI